MSEGKGKTPEGWIEHPPLWIRVTLKNADGGTFQQFKSDFNNYDAKKELRRRMVWAFLNGKVVHCEKMDA
jgi:hypothetical protein